MIFGEEMWGLGGILEGGCRWGRLVVWGGGLVGFCGEGLVRGRWGVG